MHALRVLEYPVILERLQAHCETPLGVAKAQGLKPCWEEDVWEELALTEEAYDAMADGSAPSLGAVKDLRQSVRRAEKGATLGEEELYQVAASISAMRSFGSFLRPQRANRPGLWEYASRLPEISKAEDAVFAAIDETAQVRESASPVLRDLRRKRALLGQRLIDRVQSYTTGKNRDLLSDPIYTVRDGRYVVPLKAENRGKIRGIVHGASGSGQTIYVEPEDVLQLANQLSEAESAEREEIVRILRALSARVGEEPGAIRAGIEAAGELDFLFARARLGYAMRGCIPRRMSGGYIAIKGGRHPLIDEKSVVPLDIELSVGNNVLITGPNTGGKTVAIKCVGLFVLMAQSGLMPPAEGMRLGVFTQVWADIGDEQSLQQSLSTFGAHIKNISEALRALKPNALVLFDEIGAGTDPAEGAALAKAILLEVAARKAAVLASTHYGELKAFAYDAEGFGNAAMEFDSKTLRPTYRLVMGAVGGSHALKIAERYGIPRPIVETARQALTDQDRDIAKMMEQLDVAQKQAREAQAQADRRSSELKKAEERAARKLAEADETRRKAYAEAKRQVEEALRELRLQASDLFEELKKAPHDQATAEKVRLGLRNLQARGEHLRDAYVEKPKPKGPPSADLKRGATVKIEGMAQTGVLLEDPRDGSVLAQVGPLKMTFPTHQLSLVAPEKPKMGPRKNIGFQKAQTATTELHLRMMRAEDAQLELDRFLDDSLLAGFASVRIVHGKGEGILRKLTHATLRKHPHVASFREADETEGGAGVTIAVLA